MISNDNQINLYSMFFFNKKNHQKSIGKKLIFEGKLRNKLFRQKIFSSFPQSFYEILSQTPKLYKFYESPTRDLKRM